MRITNCPICGGPLDMFSQADYEIIDDELVNVGQRTYGTCLNAECPVYKYYREATTESFEELLEDLEKCK